MMRRVVLSPALLVGRLNSSATPPTGGDFVHKTYTGPIEGATGMDNKPGLYGKPNPESYFEKEYAAKGPKLPSKNVRSDKEPVDRSDNIRVPEFDTIWGKYETAPHIAGGPENFRYHKYVRQPSNTEGVDMKDVVPSVLHKDHHPDFDYSNITGQRAGNNMLSANTWLNWDLRIAKMSLYKACLKSVPLAKHFYFLMNPLPQLKLQVRAKFMQNRNVKDPDAIRHLIHTGWTEYQEVVQMRRTRTSLQKFFAEDSNTDTNMEIYAQQEGRGSQERAWWNGEEQRREGPYDGHWSETHKEAEQEFIKLQGRVPMSWTTSKGYFAVLRPDGTNYWEKNLDYEGWYMKNVDPDKRAARKELQAWNESGYNQPMHYASKNRRGYRRLVKDVEQIMTTSLDDVYAKNREQLFQYLIRENWAESNRISAERTLAMNDDDFLSTRTEEMEVYIKQAMREMPNPRMWKTDAFYMRLRYLAAPLEYNWARIPVGAAQEKLYSEWVSDNANYAILNSPQFAAIKKDKKQNPMASSMAEFYRNFDPDVPQTRNLPWYHPEFNYDRRHKWDERCMRMKRWVDCGTIDGKRSFFEAEIHEWEQQINRVEALRSASYRMTIRHSAPRMVQLYRALNTLMDVAMANQIKAVLALQLGVEVETLGQQSVEAVQKKLDNANLADFIFKVPSIIYPDGYVQPQLGLDGTPIGPIPAQPSASPAAEEVSGAAATATA